MRIVYVNGAHSDLIWHEMRKLFWHPYFVGLVLFASAFVIALRPYDDLVDLNVVRLTIFYANSVGFFLICLVGSVYVTQRRGRTVYASLVVALSIILATVYGIVSATLLGAQIPPVGDIVLVTVFNLIFGVVGEVIFVSFLLPKIIKDISGHPLPKTGTFEDPKPGGSPTTDPVTSAVGGSIGPDPGAAERPHYPVVNILGVDFRSDEVLALSAEAHYVSVLQTNGKTRLLRGRISDAADAMPPALGRMVHRSHWVAADAADTLILNGRNYVLLLKNGKRLPVARNRQNEIKAWLGQMS